VLTQKSLDELTSGSNNNGRGGADVRQRQQPETGTLRSGEVTVQLGQVGFEENRSRKWKSLNVLKNEK
jgi:hypothetical protein